MILSNCEEMGLDLKQAKLKAAYLALEFNKSVILYFQGKSYYIFPDNAVDMLYDFLDETKGEIKKLFNDLLEAAKRKKSIEEALKKRNLQFYFPEPMLSFTPESQLRMEFLEFIYKSL